MEALYTVFGRGLRQARTEAGLTQRDVANRVGLSRTSVTNIERGTQHIALHQLYSLASAVGVEPTDLLPDEAWSLEDLVPARALKGLEASDEDRAFAVRVLSKTSGVTRAATSAADDQ